MSDSHCHIVLIDPHRAFREALAFVLDREPDLTVVDQAGSVAETRSWLEAENTPAQVVLTELQLADGTGLDILDLVQAHIPECHLIGLCSTGDKRQHAQAISAGMSGVIQKTVGMDTVIQAVRNVRDGAPVHPASEMVAMLRMANQMLQEDRTAQQALARLTPREMDVLQALALGMSDKEIAQHLKVSSNTVAAHIVHILGKLNVHSRLQAVLLGIRYGAIPFD